VNFNSSGLFNSYELKFTRETADFDASSGASENKEGKFRVINKHTNVG